jgi:hypothetical protein
MKKILLIGAGGFAGLLVLIFVLVFTLTGGAAESADKFLKQVGDGQVAEAYRSSAATFQAQQSQEQFAAVVQQLGMKGFQSATWNNRSIESGQASLEGTVKTAGGGKVPMTLKMVKENGAWKVLSMSTVEGGARATAVPPEADLKQMVTDSILSLDQAVQAKDFTGFRAKVAEIWQKQATAEQLQRSFQSFIDKEVRMQGVKDVEPEFEGAPTVGTEHQLIVKGHYPTAPSQVKFTATYLPERGAWKLVGLDLHIGS